MFILKRLFCDVSIYWEVVILSNLSKRFWWFEIGWWNWDGRGVDRLEIWF